MPFRPNVRFTPVRRHAATRFDRPQRVDNVISPTDSELALSANCCRSPPWLDIRNPSFRLG